VSELAEHFLGLVADREGGRRKKLTKEALALFVEYGWPGNVRELQNLCERAAVLTSGDTIPGELVAPWLVAHEAASASAPAGGIGVRLSRPTESPIIETFAAAAANTLIGTAHASNGMASSGMASSGMLSNGSPSATPSPAAFAAAADHSGLPSLVCDGRLTLDEIERRSIVATLERFRGHRQKSAKALGIGVRTLGLKLKKWKEEALVPAEL
jgi:DNA-binding NtrC family response regulator